QFDSRKVSKDDVFIAISGYAVDGHDFINMAVKKGATIIVYDKKIEHLPAGVTCIRVKDSRAALSRMAVNYYGNPSSEIKLIGVTGTNGKTTVATLLYELFSKMGLKTGLLSTVQNRI